MAERQVQNIVNQLRVTVNEAGNDWDLLLKHLTFQLNVSVNAMHKHSPYFLVYGRLPRTFQLDRETMSEDVQNEDEYVQMISKNQALAWKAAQELSRINQLKTKTYYDRNKQESKIKLGSIVFLYRPVLEEDKNRKMSAYYLGPFRCTKLLPNNKVQMLNLENNKPYPYDVHVSRLKHAPELSQ